MDVNLNDSCYEPYDFDSTEYIPIDVHTAVNCGLGDYVAEVISNNRHIFSKINKHGMTPLMYACLRQDVTLVESLVGAGIDVNQQGWKGRTALMMASEGCACEILEILTPKSILDLPDDFGRTALFYAVRAGQFESTKFLINIGADVNVFDLKTRFTPLMVAVQIGWTNIAHILLEAGANIYHRALNGSTALSLVETSINLDMKELFLFAQRKEFSTLECFLKFWNVEKYLPILRDKGVDFSIFLKLTEDDLRNLGITLLGPRKKMALAIASWNRGYFQYLE